MTLPPPADARVRMRNAGIAGPQGGGVYLPQVQRTRLLDAAVAIVSEGGYGGLTARRASARAGMSTKTFYDLFGDREDCFLAAFEDTVGELATAAAGAYEAQNEWSERIRGGLGALLARLDEEPALCSLVVVEALGAGPRVLERRAEVLQELAGIVDQGRAGMRAGSVLPSLTAQGVVGAVFSVVHTRFSERRGGSLTGLLSELMAMIVLPYRGPAAAKKELARPALKACHVPGASTRSALKDLELRVTRRTSGVLSAIAECPGGSNRRIADLAGVADEGQISKLLARLERLGLASNSGDAHALGEPNAWQLTPLGQQVTEQIAASTAGNGAQTA